MGKHVGWLVVPRAGRFQARYKIVGRPGLYKSKSFDDQVAAEKWAKLGAAGQLVGVMPNALDPRRSPTSSLVKDYLVRLRSLRRAESHIDDNERWLTRLANEVSDLAAPSAPAAIERWLNGLTLAADGSNSPRPLLAPATRNKVLVEVRAMCNWAIRAKRLVDDPTSAIDFANVPDYLPSVFSISELRALLAATADPYHRVFAVMVYTGFRAGEACALRWQDIDVAGRVVILRLQAGVRVKRQRERLVPLQDELLEILRLSWPASRRSATKSAPKVDPTPLESRKGHLFAGRGWNPYRGMANFLTRQGIPIDDRSPHSCRHTYASLMTASGIPGPLLSVYLGHSSISTTVLYTKIAIRFESTARDWQRGQFKLRG